MEPDILIQEFHSVYNSRLEIIICKITTEVSAKLAPGIIQNFSRHNFKFDSASKIADNILESTQMI
jgi:hypothetical protein